MRLDRELGLELHAAANLLDRKMNATISRNGAEGVTPMHGMILGFISQRLENNLDTYQKDIEAEFDIARSTVTATLKLMEKKGYIKRESVEHDARLKKIFPTAVGKKSLIQIRSSIRETENLMHDAMTTDEYSQLLKLLDKVKSVLE